MMWAKIEFKRCFFSIKTVLFLLLSICLGALCFYFAYQEKGVFLQMLVDKPVDVDLDRAAAVVEGKNGIQFGLDFLLQSDFFQIYIIVLFLFCGIFLSSRIREMLESGYMNLLVSRMQYKTYAKQMLLGQSAYIFAIVAIGLVADLIMGYCIGGRGNGYGVVGVHRFGMGAFLLFCGAQIIIVSLLAILVNGISLLLSFCLEKTLIIQCLPFFAFFVLPLLVCSTLGNLSHIVGVVTSYFIPFYNLMSAPYFLFQEDVGIEQVVGPMLPYATYLVLLLVCYRANVRKFSEDCI